MFELGDQLDLTPELGSFPQERELRTEPALAVEADGESLAATPVRYRCRDAALPVVVPAGLIPLARPAVVTNC